MIRGLQITIRGEELTRRIAERIQLHEATMGALDARIKQREGDQPFDVRPEDGFKTLGELEDERQRWQDRLSQLTLLRDSLVAQELYALSRADLRLAELISPDVTDGARISDEDWVDDSRNAPVDGLKLAITGEELRRLLDQRITITVGAPIGGNASRRGRPRNRRKTSRCCRTTCARMKQSGTSGVWMCSGSFAITLILPRSTDWVKRIWRLANCSPRSLGGWSRRNTKSAPSENDVSP